MDFSFLQIFSCQYKHILLIPRFTFKTNDRKTPLCYGCYGSANNPSSVEKTGEFLEFSTQPAPSQIKRVTEK